MSVLPWCGWKSIVHFCYVNVDCINIVIITGDDDDDSFIRACVLKPDKSLFLIIISECSSTSCCFTGCGSTTGCGRDQIRWHICQDNLCRWKLQLTFLLITFVNYCYVRSLIKLSDPWVSQNLIPLKTLDPQVSLDTRSPSTCMIHIIVVWLLLFFLYIYLAAMYQKLIFSSH